MPFDGRDFPLIAVPTVAPFCFETATGERRMLELASWLENDERWNNRLIKWNFNEVSAPIELSCGTAGCAIGLASAIWPQWPELDREANGKASIYSAINSAADMFSISSEDAAHLFGWELAEDLGLFRPKDVSPGMVATAIREFVANRSA